MNGVLIKFSEQIVPLLMGFFLSFVTQVNRAGSICTDCLTVKRCHLMLTFG